MIVTELAPFVLLVHGVVLGIGLVLGGWANWGGRIGVVMLGTSMLLLVWIIGRTLLAVRRLGRLVDGPVHDAEGRSRLIGIPVRVPDGAREILGIEWRVGLTADLTRPDDDRRCLPVCVYVHGGAWTGGDPQRQARDLYHALALDGWATVAIRYPFTPTVSVEQQIEHVRAAVVWARTGLADHGVDASHVVLAGGSAGGHLATMAALTASVADEQVEACVPVYGIFDMANRNGMRAHWALIQNSVMLTTPAEAPERFAAVSPLDRITSASPPMLVIHGTRDTLVPIGEAEQFVSALVAAGRPVEFVPIEGAQHAFDAVSSPTTRTTAALIRDWLRRTVLDA